MKKVEKKAVKAVEKKAEKAVEKKVEKVSNTQRCADLILDLARSAKHTRHEIVQTVSEALAALSVVTIKTMVSDLQNPKYAKRYSTHTIAIDRTTKVVSIAGPIK